TRYLANADAGFYLPTYKYAPTGAPGADDYACYAINTAGGTEYHLVNNLMDEPEPYGTMLKALYETLVRIQVRGNPVDRYKLIGFDETPNEPLRRFPNGGPTEFVNNTDAAFGDMIDFVNPNAGAQARTRRAMRAERMFYPRANHVSDLPAALLE